MEGDFGNKNKMIDKILIKRWRNSTVKYGEIKWFHNCS